jgi:predicted metal-dependent hydrolase
MRPSRSPYTVQRTELIAGRIAEIGKVHLSEAALADARRILASTGAGRDLGAWRGLIGFVFGRAGMLHGRWRAVAAYHRRDFHPWRYLDNRRLLSELRNAIVDPAWEV